MRQVFTRFCRYHQRRNVSYTVASLLLLQPHLNYLPAIQVHAAVQPAAQKRNTTVRETALKICWAFLTQVEVCCTLNVNPSAVSSTFPLVFQNTSDFFCHALYFASNSIVFSILTFLKALSILASTATSLV